MSLYLGENKIADNTCSRNIGEIIQSTIPLTDAGLHLLDGALISSAGSYAKFVNYIAGLVSNYPDLFETEANWQTSVTNYGVCGKFVYDSTNNTVRLPKITGFTEGTTDVTALGDLVEAGLPNITGHITPKGGNNDGYVIRNDNSEYGALYIDSSGITAKTSGLTSGTYEVGKINIDASRSNSIYGNSSTVQPQSIKVLYYIVIATSTKTDIEVDIDEIATDLNGKADVDLSNVNSTGTSVASGWSMPSSRYIDLTLGASGSTYTAPANGWLYLAKSAGTTSNVYVSIESYRGSVRCVNGGLNVGLYALLPMTKGSSAAVFYNATGTTNYFRFIYAEGEN